MLSIIIPVKDNLEISKACLDSILNYTDVPREIIVIDDGSKKKTTTMLKRYKNIKYIRNEKSVGWCKAINQGIEASNGDHIVFANNDTVVTPGWAKKMLKHFKKHKDLGVLGATTNKISNNQSIDYNKEGFDFEFTSTLIFYFVMLSRDCIDKVGGLDERFGLGGQDDSDYCIRAREKYFKCGIARDTFIYHYGSATFRKEFKNDIDKSKQFAISRHKILNDKYNEYINKNYKNYNNGNRKKVMICIPNQGTIVPELATFLIKLTHDPRYRIRTFMPKNIFPLDAARAKCVKEFLETDYEYLLWIDDDIIPPDNALDRLIQADKDIIGGACFSMKYEGGVAFPYPVTLRYNEDKKYIVYYGQGVEEVDATGGACILFKRKVYESLVRPYEFQYHRDGTLALTCDFDVFQKAQKAGFKLWIDFDVICSHIKEVDIMAVNNLLARNEMERVSG